jgi:hypothetical protein
MFWDTNYKRCEVACQYMKDVCIKTIQLYKHKISNNINNNNDNNNDTSTNNSSSSSNSDTNSNQSSVGNLIIGRLIDHNYLSDTHRYADLQALILAGHETSAYTLSFFLIHIAQHPHVKLKLQNELDRYINNELCENGRPTYAQVRYTYLMIM